MAKGRLEFTVDRCKGCELCVSVCPTKILAIDGKVLNAMGYHPISVTEMDKCIGCANCATICPDGVISVYREEREEK